MKHTLLFLLLALPFQPSKGQTLALAQTPTRSESRPAAQRSLRAVLQQLKDHYEKDILYCDKNVAGIDVPVNAVRLTLSLTNNLDAVLKPLGLLYKETRTGGYVVVAGPGLGTLSASAENGPLLIDSRLVISEIAEAEEPVTGVVRDNAGAVMVNANVTVKKTNRGAVTGADGRFRVVANAGEVLVISSIGYLTQEVTIGGQTDLAITLLPDVRTLTEVAVVGTRSTVARTKTDTPAPVDVIGVKDLSQTGQADLTQMINFVAPSFNSARQTISNGTDFIDPATLRGLGPDQVLVLINGKRQHSTALVNVNSTVGRGSVGTDLNAIPQGAIERIEVLRDGAAAQYGSDAIAGVINVVLKKNSGSGTLVSQAGLTAEGDGKTALANLNYGFGVGKKGGYVNLTLNLSHRDPTNRTGPYNNTVYLAALPATRFPGTPVFVPLTTAQVANQQQDNGLVAERGFNRNGMIVGNSRLTNYAGFVNFALPVGNKWEIYGFGGFNQRNGRAAGFYRYPNAIRTNNLTLFPNGYLPLIDTDIKDQSAVVGIRRSVPLGWNLDLSNSYGGNSIGFNVSNSINASLGNTSPTNFYCGKLSFNQNTTNLTVSKGIPNFGFTKFFNMAFGAEFRIDDYGIEAGEEKSWQNYNAPGTPAAQVKAAGVQVFGGFRPSNAINQTRSNLGVFADLESDLTDKLLISGALRYENYSDFGSNLSGKLAGRYKITDAFAVRGGVNRGFRAPSLHQRYYSAVATQFITVAGVNQQREVTTVRNDDPVTKQLGIPTLKPETSWSYSLGITANIQSKLLLTVDAYRIAIQDRIVISGRFSSTVPQLVEYFKNTDVNEAQFFTNAIDTQTDGIDAVLTYKETVGNYPLTFNAALNLNKTTIVGGAAGVRTPTQLTGLGETLLNREERGRIEVNQPRSKFIMSGMYQPGPFNIRLATTRFGEISTIAPQDPLQDQNFAAKWVTDASVGYRFGKVAVLTLGANNVFNVYPDKVADPRLTNEGTVIYSRFATQFGFNGAYYFTNLAVNF